MSKSFSLFLLAAVSLIFFSDISFARFSQQVPDSPKQPLQDRVSNSIPNIEGKWKISITGENRATTFTLIQKGNTLTGKFRGEMGDLPLTGTITNDRKMAFTARFGGLSVKFAGTVEGKTMKGIVDLPMGRGRKNWTATKGV